MKRERNLVYEPRVRVWEIRDIEPEIFIRGMHRERFIMDVARNIALRHFNDNLLPFRKIRPGNPRYIEMPGRLTVGAIMVENFDAQRLKRGVVTRNELAPSFQHAGVALELRQTDSGGYVRHIALIPRPDDVVFPRAKLRFGKRVFRLAVQREKLEITVNLRVVDSRKAAPHDRAAFAGRKVFNRVEGEGRKVGHAPKLFVMVRRAKRVRRVLANCDAP